MGRGSEAVWERGAVRGLRVRGRADDNRSWPCSIDGHDERHGDDLVGEQGRRCVCRVFGQRALLRASGPAATDVHFHSWLGAADRGLIRIESGVDVGVQTMWRSQIFVEPRAYTAVEKITLTPQKETDTRQESGRG